MSIDNVKPITLQELFNIGWKHFVLDNAPLSVNDNGECMYRGKNGAKCFIGLVISDEMAKKYEEVSAETICRDNPSLFDENSISPEILGNAQYSLHDVFALYDGDEDTKEYREEAYRDFAVRYNLTIPNAKK